MFIIRFFLASIKFVLLLAALIFYLIAQASLYLFYYPWRLVGKMRRIDALSLEQSPVINLLVFFEGIFLVAIRALL